MQRSMVSRIVEIKFFIIPLNYCLLKGWQQRLPASLLFSCNEEALFAYTRIEGDFGDRHADLASQTGLQSLVHDIDIPSITTIFF